MERVEKLRVYVDMDDTICRFFKAAKKALTENPSQPYPQSQWCFFLGLEPMEGAIEGFRKLEEKYDLSEAKEGFGHEGEEDANASDERGEASDDSEDDSDESEDADEDSQESSGSEFYEGEAF